ncbi:MAG: heat-inducible transcriptional repressor HrcA [Clostridiales bacterium]|jgi:heat-inducible transcriptional repressor|nr:heat-inducible transcriptional repressor HrcA [Clostridiales bacterium]
MSISVRKERILQAVVEDYINTARAISSSDVQAKHLPELSSATIRNELSALEELGYLYQPHTSAGRVPTPEAYKLYIEKLMPRRKLTNSELDLIKSYFSNQVVGMGDVLRKTAKVISEITNYTSIAVASDMNDAIIENIRIVKLTPHSALVVVVTDRGVLKDSTVQVEGELSDDYFDTAARFTLEAFRGRKISDLASPDPVIEQVCGEFKVFFDTVMQIIVNYSDQLRPEDFMLEGVSKIFDQPEYNSMERARAMMGVLEGRERLFPVLKAREDMQLSINIGRESSNALSDCAIVTANYIVDGKPIGQAGVIGPIRMNYSKVVSVLDYISQTLKGSSDNESGGIAISIQNTYNTHNTDHDGKE